MHPLHIKTPLLESLPLSQRCGKTIYLKMDALQPSGSFKIRGIGRLCQEAAKEGKREFVAASGGNAGLAVAYAGRKLGIPVTIFIPDATGEGVLKSLKMEGAEVIISGHIWDDAHEKALARAEAPGCQYIHPFDHPIIWAGHETLMEEVKEERFKPGGVVLSVGGGGLLCGVVAALEKFGWKDIPVIAVETEGAASYKAALDAGKPVALSEIHTLATTLGVKCVAEEAFRWSKCHPIFPCIVSDKMAVHACLRFARDHRILVEPACGAALSVVYENSSVLQGIESLLVIVCGGSDISLEKLMVWEKQYHFGH
ncbi:MAG: pyridoxal-phosphate dependent enzyme [Gammaproteobacteria bacterium]|nr:pyridoxal-phosphate dependent enzyme [Gammaproteobacteria bacterium]